MARRRNEIDSRQSEVQALLVSQMAELDAAIAERRAAQEEQSLRLVTHSETIASQLDQFSTRMAEIAANGGEAESQVAANLASLAEKLAASREALNDTDRIVAGLDQFKQAYAAVGQAGVKHASDDLPKAMAQGEASLSGLEARIASLNEAANGAERSGEGLADSVRHSSEALATTLSELDRMHGTIGTKTAEHVALLGELREALAGIDTSSTELADRAQSELRVAIDALRGSAKDAIENLGTMSAASLQARR
jgi:DNA repair exonuclease SbcCD ATPase subunit